jgi:hypothetical protein
VVVIDRNLRIVLIKVKDLAVEPLLVYVFPFLDLETSPKWG